MPDKTILLFGALALAATVLALTLLMTRSASVTSTATAGNFTVQVPPAPVKRGAVVHLTVVVRGPAEFETACGRPTPEMWAVSPTGHRIALNKDDSLCQSGGLNYVQDGRSETFVIEWQTSTNSVPGRYVIYGQLFGFKGSLSSDGKLPSVAVDIMA